MAEQPRWDRILRQRLAAERLLGVDVVPVRAAADVADPAAQVPHVSADQMPAPARQRDDVMRKPTPDADGPPLADAPRVEPLDRKEKLRRLQALDEGEVRGCTLCVLCESRTNTVFGEGDPDAKLMFVGEGPGQNEDEQGRPFVGRAGDLLERMIQAMGLSREQVYIANVVKCRPPNNRAPTPDESDACAGYLRQQVEIIQPKVIVTLGGPAMKRILGLKQGITSVRGTWHETREFGTATGEPLKIMPTFHPAYLLRSYTKENRAKVWADLKMVMDVLKLKAT